MAIAELVYRITPPRGRSVDDVVEDLASACRSMVQNQWIRQIGIDIETDHLVFMIMIEGHDRWWIKRRAPYLVVAILTRADLHITNTELVEVRSVRSLRNASYWTEGARNKGRRVFEPPDGVKREPIMVQRRPKPTSPQLVEKRSGWHHTYHGRGR